MRPNLDPVGMLVVFPTDGRDRVVRAMTGSRHTSCMSLTLAVELELRRTVTSFDQDVNVCSRPGRAALKLHTAYTMHASACIGSCHPSSNSTQLYGRAEDSERIPG